ncbi:MAG: diaminopimelate decarboxylase [Dinghuibacter sp.]|nr:diaminopimelate decarboxylase [Dinghuibacter sp.]
MLTNETLIAIAQEYGTPVYVYDADKITEQYNKLTEAFAGTRPRFFYAAKSLTNINILKLMHSLGAGVDTVSINEVKLALHAGFEPGRILFTPNCVAFEELDEARSLGVHINIDNISLLEQFGNKYGGSYPVIIRINPHIMAGGNFKISTGHVDSKFGISIHQMRHIERIVRTTGLTVHGLHMHTGSEIKDIGVFTEGLEVIFNAVKNFKDLKYIDLGSGFKVPYTADDYGTDIYELGRQLQQRVEEYRKENGSVPEIWFEPGKYMVSESGFFVVRVNVIKQTPATVFAGVNSGFNHFIRPMFYEAWHLIRNISNPQGTERIYTVVGNLCETDTFGWDRRINEIREGDFLLFHNAGAYGFEMSSNFNSRLRPAEVLWKNGQAHLIRKRDQFEDLLRGQIELAE